MPIYEYRCPQCDHIFARLQRVGADASGMTCPQCGADQVQRQFSTFASTATGSTAGSAASCNVGSG